MHAGKIFQSFVEAPSQGEKIIFSRGQEDSRFVRNQYGVKVNLQPPSIRPVGGQSEEA